MAALRVLDFNSREGHPGPTKATVGIDRLCVLEDLAEVASLDCQPKSKEDAVYVSEKWRNAILEKVAMLGAVT